MITEVECRTRTMIIAITWEEYTGSLLRSQGRPARCLGSPEDAEKEGLFWDCFSYRRLRSIRTWGSPGAVLSPFREPVPPVRGHTGGKQGMGLAAF